MKKEEILEASKKDNKKRDPYAVEVGATAAKIASLGMVVLAFLYLIIEWIKTHSFNPSTYSIITLFNTIVFGYTAIKLDKNKKVNTFTAIIWGIFTILLILDYFEII